MSQPAVKVDGVSKTFRYRPYARGTLTLKSALLDALLFRPRPPRVTVEAVKDVTFEVAPGEALGVVGANGAGKTTLLRLVAGVYRPDTGTIDAPGRRGMLLDLGASFHPDLSGYENALVASLVAGMSEREFQGRIDAIAQFAELEEALHAPVRTYSDGMRLRLGFSVASSVSPDVLLVDEILAVGDHAFQQKCLARIEELRADGTALVVASHDLVVVQRICERALWMRDGALAALGPAAEVCETYLGAGTDA